MSFIRCLNPLSKDSVVLLNLLGAVEGVTETEICDPASMDACTGCIEQTTHLTISMLRNYSFLEYQILPTSGGNSMVKSWLSFT